MSVWLTTTSVEPVISAMTVNSKSAPLSWMRTLWSDSTLTVIWTQWQQHDCRMIKDRIYLFNMENYTTSIHQPLEWISLTRSMISWVVLENKPHSKYTTSSLFFVLLLTSRPTVTDIEGLSWGPLRTPEDFWGPNGLLRTTENSWRPRGPTKILEDSCRPLRTPEDHRGPPEDPWGFLKII